MGQSQHQHGHGQCRRHDEDADAQETRGAHLNFFASQRDEPQDRGQRSSHRQIRAQVNAQENGGVDDASAVGSLDRSGSDEAHGQIVDQVGGDSEAESNRTQTRDGRIGGCLLQRVGGERQGSSCLQSRPRTNRPATSGITLQ